MPKVALLIEAGSMSSSVMTTLDMLSIAARYAGADDCRVDLLSSTGGAVRLGTAACVDTFALPDSFEHYDAVVMPGFSAEDAASLTVKLETTWRPAVDRLRGMPPGVLAAASCYGTFVLAESGLLNGRRATTTWWSQALFRERYPDVMLDADQTLADGGNVITAGAMTAHTDLSLHVLRRLYGAALARAVGGIMLVDGARTSQRPFMALQRDFPDPLIREAAEWMEKHCAEAVSAEELASALNVSYRTLHRRFRAAAGMAPMAYLQALRVENAKHLLESTRLSLEQIVEKIGYHDASAFRRLFTRTAGLSPAQYRRRFTSR